MSLPQTHLHTLLFTDKLGITPRRNLLCHNLLWTLLAILGLVLLLCALPQLPAARAAAAQYGWQKAGAGLVASNVARAKVTLNRATGGALFANATMFVPTLGLTKSLVPASPTALPTARAFTYRLSWRCAGSVSPQDVAQKNGVRFFWNYKINN